MQYIDFHCDTLMQFGDGDFTGNSLYENPSKSIDLVRMKKGDARAQFFATFLPPAQYMHNSDEEYRANLYKGFTDTINAHSDIIGFAKSVADYDANIRAGKMSAFLTFEDGRMVDSFEKMNMYYELGYRLISLTWNGANCFGFPNSADPEAMKKGLTAYGKEAIEVMNDMGIIIDVSHLSDGGFYDIVDITKKPFVASHSCARGLTNHQRNLTDDMLRKLADKGGFVGINFCPAFVGDTATKPEDAVSALKNICDHICYMANIAGKETVGLGSDWDGISGKLDVADPTDLYKIYDELKRRGWTESEIEKFAYKNADRLIRETLN